MLAGHGGFHIHGENCEVVCQLKPHFLIQADGGCRYCGRSAISYVVYGVLYGYGADVQCCTLAYGGERLSGAKQSLDLEAQALALGLGVLVDLLAAYW